VMLLASGADYFNEGFDGFVATLKSIDPNLVKTTNEKSFLFRDYFEIIFCQIVIGIAIVCQPHIITKTLFLKSEKSVNQYLVIAIICMILFYGCYCWVVRQNTISRSHVEWCSASNG